ncbi:MAG: preprotein translocase subunit SecG [Candidatus Magasanikbacteria bacterium]
MTTVLTIIQIIFGILLILAVLLQQKGSGLGAGFGGNGSGIMLTKRGADLFLHRATIVLSVLFFGTGFIMLFL